MRLLRAVKRSTSPWSAERRPVTRVALSWSSHRSGAATCSPRSAISTRMASMSSTCSMVCIVAWSCLISCSKSGPAITSKVTGRTAEWTNRSAPIRTTLRAEWSGSPRLVRLTRGGSPGAEHPR